MKFFIKGIFFISFAIFSIFTSCSDDPKEEISPLIIDAQLNGLLGEEITIVGENFEVNKLQIFFDLEEAYLTYFTPTEIKFQVPRTLKRYDPNLKIINLETNEDILNTKFTLKSPKVTGYSDSDGDNTAEITFDEKLIINGENFDINKDFIEVRINSEKAQVLSVTHDIIEVYIPYKILDANLEVEVDAQLQSTKTNVDLKLKNPIIEVLLTDAIRSYSSNLQVTGINFNPEEEFGEVFLDGVPCSYSSGNNGLNINVPAGPFNEFKIKKITYKTAGLITTFDVDIDILTPGIMVDHLQDLYGLDVITYNDKAYTFSADTDSDGFGYRIGLYEFTQATEKWQKIESFGFDGYINDFAFDNINSIYLYKGVADSVKELTKLNLDDFTETKIETPFHESLYDASFFSFKDNLYVLYGSTYENNQTVPSEKKYVYKGDENIWEEMDSSEFTESVWGSGRISRRIFHQGHLFLTFSYRGGTSKLDDNLNLTHVLDYNIGDMMFAYNGKIICDQPNIINGRSYLYDIYDQFKVVKVQFAHSHFGWFFVLGNTIYYHAGSAGNYSTFKLREDFLNEIL